MYLSRDGRIVTVVRNPEYAIQACVLESLHWHPLGKTICIFSDNQAALRGTIAYSLPASMEVYAKINFWYRSNGIPKEL